MTLFDSITITLEGDHAVATDKTGAVITEAYCARPVGAVAELMTNLRDMGVTFANSHLTDSGNPS